VSAVEHGWFSASEQPALLDFWRVYESSYDEMQRETTPIVEQHPVFGHVFAVKHRADRLEHRIDRDIGEKTEATLIDSDESDVERREGPGDVEHRPVPAEDDREVSPRSELLERQHRIRTFSDVGGGEPVEQHFDATPTQKTGKLEQRAGDFGAFVFAYQRDCLERRSHGPH